MPKTEITPKQLFERRNTDNVFNREVILGLLKLLNRKLIYQQIWNNTEEGIENVTVPFFYDFGGSNISSERFIQDNYTFFTSTECLEIGMKKIDGNFDFYPQGRLSLGGVNIESSSTTNRYVMYRYTKIVNGKPQPFVAYMYSIPLQFQFSVEIRCPDVLTQFKIDQAYREYFFKNKTFRFNYNGTVVPCRVGFPESVIQPQGAGATYSMGQAGAEQWHKLSMTLQVETYQPVFDPFTERPADNMIKGIGSNIWLSHNDKDGNKIEHESGPLWWKTDFSNLVAVCGETILLEWDYSYRDKDLMQVDLCYKIDGDDEEYIIGSMDNHCFTHWHIPEDFIENHDKIDIMIPNTDYCAVQECPEIYIYADPKTGTVDESNVRVISKGFFVTPDPDGTVECIVSYNNRDDKLVEYPALIHLHNYMVDEINPIEFCIGDDNATFVDFGENQKERCFVFDNDIDSKRVKIILRDHNQKNIYCESPWFLIV